MNSANVDTFGQGLILTPSTLMEESWACPELAEGMRVNPLTYVLSPCGRRCRTVPDANIGTGKSAGHKTRDVQVRLGLEARCYFQAGRQYPSNRRTEPMSYPTARFLRVLIPTVLVDD